MATKNSPRVRLDAFVAAARRIPADGAPLLFTSGYVGRSPTEGKLRIYWDPSLSRWIEAAEEGVVPPCRSPIPRSAGRISG